MREALWGGLLLSLFCFLGCQSAGGPPPAGKTQDEGFDLASLKIVAFLGLAPGGGSDKLAVPIFEPVLERHLAGIAAPFVILSMNEAESRAQRNNVLEDLQVLTDYWRDHHKVDKMRLQALSQSMAIDGVLVAGLSDWMQVEAPPAGDEPAYTKIGATLSLYDAQSGRRVWRTRTTRTVEAAQYQDDGGATTRNNPMGAGYVGGLRTGADAPALEDVSELVAEELAEALAR